MRRRGQKTTFWMFLVLINIAALIYPINLYIQADGNSAKFLAAMILVGVGFLLAIADTFSAIIAYL
jgi:hypothetical protein